MSRRSRSSLATSLTPALALLALIAAPGARAAIGTLDVVPAATLLVPWFEESLDDNLSTTTLVIVSSTTSDASLAKVTLWTDAGIPTFAFHIYLTGYDVQAFRLRDLFTGFQPLNAPLNLDPFDTVSPRGDLSQERSFPGCTAADFATVPSAATLPADLVARLARQHRGQPDTVTGRCSARNFGDGVVRGYLTIDVVNGCSSLLPDAPGYFVTGGGGVAANDNILVGEVRYVNPGQNFAWGDVAVHIEADAIHLETSAPGQYTFYGRLVGWTAADNREPLATRWAVPFHNVEDAAFTVWRDPKVPIAPFTCGSAVAFTPAGTWVAFDMAENALDISLLVPRLATATVLRVGDDLDLPSRAGWLSVDLSTTLAGAGAPEDPAASQGFVSVTSTLDVCGGEGRFIGGYHAVALDSATDATPVPLDVPVVQP